MSTPLFRVEHPGLLTTVQDLGRVGRQRDGIIVGGAMDTFAAQVANILAGNSRSEAVLEITLRGPTLRVLAEVRVVVSGADLTAQIDGQPLPLWRSVLLGPGQTVRFGARRAGTRAYLAVTGGLDVPRVLDSRSTFLRAKIGGFAGRALRLGDILLGTPFKGGAAGRTLASSAVPVCQNPALVRVVPGPHSGAFEEETMQAFFATTYVVTTQSDRMGYRLEGIPLDYSARFSGSLLSEAAPLGGIQIPPNGQPILLMADRQTTGGYPLLGVAASVDLPRAAQVGPGDFLRFQPISLWDAQDLHAAQERFLRLLASTVTDLP